MLKRPLILALLLANISTALAVEDTLLHAMSAAKDGVSGAKQANEVKRKSVERKAGEMPKNFRRAAKPLRPLLEEKNFGLGCAQG